MRAHMIALGLILASSQAAISAPAGICVRQAGIKDWAVLNEIRLIVVDRTDKKFRLSLSGACSGLQVRTTLAFRPVSKNDCLARDDAVGGSLPGYPEPAQRCPIAEID